MARGTMKEKVSPLTKNQIHEIFEAYCEWDAKKKELEKKMDEKKKILIAYVKDNGDQHTEKSKIVKFLDGEMTGTETERRTFNAMAARQTLPSNVYSEITEEVVKKEKFDEAVSAGLITKDQVKEIVTVTPSWSLSCKMFG